MSKKDQAVDKIIFELQSSVVWIKGHTLTVKDFDRIKNEVNTLMSMILQQVGEDKST